MTSILFFDDISRAKVLATKQKSLDEERAKPKTYLPQKPSIPKPPTSPPERQHKGTKTSTRYQNGSNDDDSGLFEVVQMIMILTLIMAVMMMMTCCFGSISKV